MTRDGTDDATARGGRHWSLRGLEPQPESVAVARREVRAVLDDWGADRFEWEVSQLVTELVTNVVLHARTGFDLSMELDGDRLRLEVRDASPLLPRPRRFSRESTTGRGMRLVETLAQSWGVQRRDGGKTVWLELVPAEDVDGGPADLDGWFDDDDQPTGAPVGTGAAGSASSADAPTSDASGAAAPEAVVLPLAARRGSPARRRAAA
jgi:anti-sigma regulatory factor (Ser/Thr protein kinase)